ncbi:MAG: peptidyl-prolyl cis-trans isomerase [Candidatus Eisenbacteria bacterium]|nr:peptidyl-prolyl cis-trans isomerase [Candidatus Eisenbacteria bacterium]
MIRRIAILTISLVAAAVMLAPAGVPAQEEAVAVAEEGASKEAAANKVLFKTTKGDLVIELYPDEAPLTVDNFLRYVREGFYDGTIFHRVIPGFVIQGGGFTSEMNKKSTHPPIKNEADNGLKNLRGTLSMARTNDIHSATSQFFINLRDNASLDHRGDNPQAYGYAVFGKVVEGMDVVDEIAAVETGKRGMYSDVPKETIVVEEALVMGASGEESD